VGARRPSAHHGSAARRRFIGSLLPAGRSFDAWRARDTRYGLYTPGSGADGSQHVRPNGMGASWSV